MRSLRKRGNETGKEVEEMSRSWKSDKQIGNRGGKRAVGGEIERERARGGGNLDRGDNTKIEY